MSANELSIVIKSLLTLIVLVFVIFRLWPEQRIDLFRQEMFALRDELFDFAADGKVSFEDPAYKLLRELMNGFIRYAHNLTPYRVLISFLRWKYGPQSGHMHSWKEAWEEAVNAIEDSEARTQLNLFHSKATMLVLSQLVLSPGLIPFVLTIGAVTVVLYSQWTSLRNIYNDVRKNVPISFLEEEAVKS
jgi:hypothetical protein